MEGTRLFGITRTARHVFIRLIRPRQIAIRPALSITIDTDLDNEYCTNTLPRSFGNRPSMHRMQMLTVSAQTLRGSPSVLQCSLPDLSQHVNRKLVRKTLKVQEEYVRGMVANNMRRSCYRAKTLTTPSPPPLTTHRPSWLHTTEHTPSPRISL